MRDHYLVPPQTYLNFLRFLPSCLLLDVSLFSPKINFPLSLFFYPIFTFCYLLLSYAFFSMRENVFSWRKMKIIKFINNNFNAFFHLEKKPLSLLKFKQSEF